MKDFTDISQPATRFKERSTASALRCVAFTEEPGRLYYNRERGSCRDILRKKLSMKERIVRFAPWPMLLAVGMIATPRYANTAPALSGRSLFRAFHPPSNFQ